MNWDWDKLQERRQRQVPWGGFGGFGRDSRHDDDDDEPDDNGEGPRRPPIPFKKMPTLNVHGVGWIKWVVLAAVVIWLATGIYIVNPDEQGVVLRFGKYDRTVDAGPHYAFPYPIETAYKPKVTQVQRAEIGFRSMAQGGVFQQGANRAVPEEASMLTGDENIVSVQFSVQFQIKDPVEYLFNVTNPPAVVKSAAEAAMREVIGNSLIDSALTDGKLQIQNEATELLQQILNRYKVGVRVLAVQLQNVHPPQEVSDAFKDVASAREDKSRFINEAEAYRNELLPKARGQAAAVENAALAYKETRIRHAEGESTRFLALLAEYEQAKDVTKKRLYLEAMEEILSSQHIRKVILPNEAAGHVLPILPLSDLPPALQNTARKLAEQAQTTKTPTGQKTLAKGNR